MRYADDTIMHATTADELIFMMNALVKQLCNFGLHLNPLKSKILTTVDVGTTLYLDIAGNISYVLIHADVHIYPGTQVSGNLSQRH